MDTKAVLFVNNDQTERLVMDPILKQRVRANQKLALAAGEFLKNLFSSAARVLPLSQPTLIPSGSNHARKLTQCCSARISVGAISAT